MTLLEQIQYAERKRFEIAQRLAEQDVMIMELKSYRVECKHDFSPALRGYEHEGGTCKLCGINEVYWDHIKPKT